MPLRRREIALICVLSPIWIPLFFAAVPVGVLCHCAVPASLLIRDTIRRSPTINRKKQERKNKKPRAVSRERRMTFDASTHDISMQMVSPFFLKLPPEIRHVIYEHVACGEVHLALVSGKLRSFSTPHRIPDDVFVDRDRLPGAGSLGMLQACRRMYVSYMRSKLLPATDTQ
jgi:hypothetical protein